MKDKKQKFPSELRLDPVSQDWVLIATGRARRPETFQKDARVSVEDSASACPFEKLDEQEKPTAIFLNGKQVGQGSAWSTIAIPNKYPAFSPIASPHTSIIGPYQTMEGVGFHEVIITKDHTRDIPEFSLSETKELIDVYQERYLSLMKKEFVDYISIFKNKGKAAGATIAHPHSQLIATPVIAADIQRSLRGSKQYFVTYNTCVHCSMLEWDLKEKKRIVFENDAFVVLCPFASRVAFEVRVYPKAHLSYFEQIIERQKEQFSEVLLVAMKKLSRALNNPDYNYFIHTAPVDEGKHMYYHWHLEIFPKTSTWAGFEISTGIEISTIEPEQAAAFLRKQ
ncbi:MAG: galactose-1-phosphate uridylyltransferase [Parcubacteria group bacterium]|nr:galactose-1-phosphate uridylyltransferase [Parcubacteria group bacterium]